MPRRPSVASLMRFAGEIDLPDLGLAEVIFVAELGQLAAGAALGLLDVAGGRMAQPEQRPQQHADGHQVDDLANEGTLRIHLATSRVLRNR